MPKKILYLVCLLPVFVALGSCSNYVDTDVSKDQIAEVFQLLADESVNKSFDATSGTAISIISPKLDINWSGVSGFDSKEKTDTLGLDQPFRIASVSKTFVAAAILRLHEMDSLDIDESISKYISLAHIQLLEKGGYVPSEITLRHCLNHTAGLHDYALGSRTFHDMIVANPQRGWTRTEQLQIAMTTGMPKGSPGELYSYCDTGYILLGEAIESVTDTSLAISLRGLLDYEEIGLGSTWLESKEPAVIKDKGIAHCYFGRNDATEWNATIDTYGGGGLISTSQDLAVFMYNLMNDEIYDHLETKELMLSPTVFIDEATAKEVDDFQDYRLGVGVVEVFGEIGYMHQGFWGSFMLYIPAYDCAIAGYTVDGSSTRLIKKIWSVLKNQVYE